MILRHLANGIRNQDWFVVLTELLVVVVGIFLGLQVDNWSEERREKKDEQEFLAQLHQDILHAEQLSSRVRARRLDSVPSLIEAAEVLFGRAERDTLSEVECIAIASSTYFNINVSSLPAYAELAGTGRLGIIRNKELRTALVELEQVREALSTLILEQTMASGGANLSSRYPDLIRLESYYDPERGEIRSKNSCDLEKMRANRAFLNDFSVDADRYDAYVRDGLQPWSNQFETVHELVDSELGIEHG